MLVLGVDPGSRVTGYGLIRKARGNLTCIHKGTIRPPAKIPFYERIHAIFRAMVEIITTHRPEEMAVEDIFFAKNVKSSLKIGHARGAVLIAAVQCGVKIFDYTPLEIKSAVVGYGRAPKEQVRSMVQVILRLNECPELDASDALAAAICHLNWTRYDTRAATKVGVVAAT
jgi:crossover junction endodeoxyribonuclease RuvC